MKRIIITYLLLGICFHIDLFSQNISIDDFKLELDTSYEERYQILDRRDFLLSPNKNKILIVGKPPSHQSTYWTQIEIATISNDEKQEYKIFRILFKGKEDIRAKWLNDQEIVIEYSFADDGLITIKKNQVRINDDLILIRYQDIESSN